MRVRLWKLGPSALLPVRPNSLCLSGRHRHGHRSVSQPAPVGIDRLKSDKKGRFLREEEHEWYDEEWDDEQEKRIWAACMRRHRLNLLEYGSPSCTVHAARAAQPPPNDSRRFLAMAERASARSKAGSSTSWVTRSPCPTSWPRSSSQVPHLDFLPFIVSVN